jgi:hypothetical protein
MSYICYFYDDDDEINEDRVLGNYSDDHDSIGSDGETRELASKMMYCKNTPSTYELISPKEAENLFLQELDQKKVLLWCDSCSKELHFENPTVLKIVHHFRQGGTTYYTSGNCPKCCKSTWKHFRFIK